MNWQHVKTFFVAFILSIFYLWTVSFGSIQVTFGQAEDTFGQNATFLEEVEQSQRQTETKVPAERNQTTGAVQTLAPTSEGGNQRPTGLVPPSNNLSLPKVPIVLSGDNVYIVWWTNESGDWEVMFKASNDNGETFGKTINLSNSTDASSVDAEIAASGSKVFVSWRESDRNGNSFNPVLRISDNSGFSFGPLLELSEDDDSGGNRISYNTSQYENSTYGVHMDYPSEWQIREGENDANQNIIDLAGFISPREYRLDKYRERLWISLENPTSENISLVEYSRDLIDFKNGTMQDFSLLDYNTDSNVLAGYPAYRLVYERSLDNGLTIKEMEIGTKIDNKVYFLVYSAQEEEYADFLPLVQRMINSFDVERE